MINLKNSLLIGTAFLFVGCSTVTNYSKIHQIPKNGTITILPFQNNTNTPLAGQRVKNIMAGILFAKNHSVKTASLNEEYITEDIVHNIAEGINTKYFVSGSVNEWRYKTGIEAEPAVAVSFRVVDKENGNIVYSAVGAKNGWGQESIGSVAQKLILELTDN